MKKSVIAIIIALVAVSLIGYVVLANNNETDDQTVQPNGTSDTAGSSDEVADTPAASSNSVVIEDYAFVSKKITVKKGTTVTWTNKDSDEHDVTPDTETAEFKQSELLAKGESYSVTFDTVGTYTYFCSPHPHMTGTVEVTE